MNNPVNAIRIQIDNFINQRIEKKMSFFEGLHELKQLLAVNVGARKGLQSALIGPCGRILTTVYL
jgi:hypothetical protein